MSTLYMFQLLRWCLGETAALAAAVDTAAAVQQHQATAGPGPLMPHTYVTSTTSLLCLHLNCSAGESSWQT
jgi:hypothetical protein